MEVRQWKRIVVLMFIAGLALPLCKPVSALPVPLTVLHGSDYLATEEGTFFMFPGIGRVDFEGLPFGPGDTDTIVKEVGRSDLSCLRGHRRDRD